MDLNNLNNPQAPESPSERSTFGSTEKLIRYLESLGVDRSSVFEFHGSVVFRERPMTNLNFIQPAADNAAAPGTIVLTEGGKLIIKEIRSGVFKPAPRPDLVGPEVKLRIEEVKKETAWPFKQLIGKVGGGFWDTDPLDLESGTDEADLLGDERKGILVKKESGFFLQLNDGALLPLNTMAIGDLDTIGNGIDQYVGKVLEVRVDDSQDPPIVTEIFFQEK